MELTESLLYIEPVSESNEAVIQTSYRLFLVNMDTLEIDEWINLKDDDFPVKASHFGGLIVKTYDNSY